MIPLSRDLFEEATIPQENGQNRFTSFAFFCSGFLHFPAFCSADAR